MEMEKYGSYMYLNCIYALHYDADCNMGVSFSKWRRVHARLRKVLAIAAGDRMAREEIHIIAGYGLCRSEMNFFFYVLHRCGLGDRSVDQSVAHYAGPQHLIQKSVSLSVELIR